MSGEDLYSVGAANASILARQLGADHRLAEALERLHYDFLPPPRTDVLLVVQLEIENEAVIEIFSESGYELIDRSFSSINAYHIVFGGCWGAGRSRKVFYGSRRSRRA